MIVQRSGSSRWSRWPSPLLTLSSDGETQVRARPFRKDLLATGWRTSATGASPVSSGGDTASRRSTATTAARSIVVQDATPYTLPEVRQQAHRIRTRTRWIPGSPLRCGRSRRSAGRTRPRSWTYFYPTNTLVTGYDIIFFWVARMIFSGMEQMGKMPVQDGAVFTVWCATRRARKMSKSLGNGIDPLEIIDQYGADALRFTLATGNSPGQRHAFLRREGRAPAATSANKIWNASRFILMNLTMTRTRQIALPERRLRIEDKWICQQVQHAGSAMSPTTSTSSSWVWPCSKLYDFIWDELLRLVYRNCKDPPAGTTGEARMHSKVLCLCAERHHASCCTRSCRSSPRTIWQALPHEGAIASWYPQWPEYNDDAALCR